MRYKTSPSCFPLSLCLFGKFLLLCLLVSQAGAVERVLPEGRLPDDRRLGPLKDLDGYFPFTPSATPQQWQRRSEEVRRQILVATGLWPMPTKTDSHAAIYGKVERDGYTVEKVTLESYPGFFVTGSLYRPTGKTGKLPGVLSPHGHFHNGRFHEAGLKEVREQIVAGAERFEVGGRYPLQARCVQLARMGCIVFQWDMVGYADSQQIPEAVAHRYKERRPEMESAENWGFFSPQAELHLQSIMGLQTYNSIRVIDWFSALPDVDPKRIAVTGESGGGTQTMLIGAVDSRPAALFPAVMVSTAMQGGCTCENCCYLRIGTGNIEFAAMAAPRPLGMTAADDWTKELATKGLPQLQQLYATLGVPDRVSANIFLQFPHNYNYVSRSAMYDFMNRQLKLGLPTPIVEEDFKPLTPQEQSVWDDKHPRPPGGPEFERKLLRWMTEDSRRQLEELAPKDPGNEAEVDKFRKIVNEAWQVLVGRYSSRLDDVLIAPLRVADHDSYTQTDALVRYLPGREELPVSLLKPGGDKWNGQVVIWLTQEGRQGAFDDDQPKPELKKLVAAGSAVVVADLLYQGEFLADGQPLKNARRVANPREYAGFTYGYNRPLPAARTQDVVSLISAMREIDGSATRIAVVGIGPAAGWVAAACRTPAPCGPVIERMAVDPGGFRYSDVTSINDVNFWPGAAKYGDIPTLVALSGADRVLAVGLSEKEQQVAKAILPAFGRKGNITLAPPAKNSTEAVERIVEFLLKP